MNVLNNRGDSEGCKGLKLIDSKTINDPLLLITAKVQTRGDDSNLKNVLVFSMQNNSLLMPCYLLLFLSL